MADEKFPALDPAGLDATRRAVHAYSRVIGVCCKAARRKRKHWWHASLRPSLHGLTTGVIYGGTDFEIELDLVASRLHVRTGASSVSERLVGQSSAAVATTVRDTLLAHGVEDLIKNADPHGYLLDL